MEVVSFMKNVIIFASQECCSGMLEVSLLNSLYTVEHIAKDIDVVSEELNTNGYNAYVYYLHNNTHVENKRSISKNVKKATVVTDDNLATVLSKCEKAVLLGVPAMLGTTDSFADRNYGNMWFDFFLNGEKMGQMGMIKTLLAVYGIPVMTVMSDSMGVLEAIKLFDKVETVVSVYDSIICPGGWQCCSAYPVEKVHEKLKKAISLSLTKDHIIPDKPKFPMEAKVEYIRTDFCDIACAYNPKLKRLDARNVTWQINDIKTISDMALRGEE